MDILGSLRKLIGVAFAPQPQQPAPPARKDIQYTNGQQVQPTQKPYQTSNIQIGTVDKPFQPVQQYHPPVALKTLVPNAPKVYRSLSADASGNLSLLDDDNANTPPIRVNAPQQLPDQPSIEGWQKNYIYNQPIRKRSFIGDYPSMRT